MNFNYSAFISHSVLPVLHIVIVTTIITRGTALVERKPPTNVVANPATFNFGQNF